MTRKTRVTLFLFLAILFLIAAPLTILYCLGWRFDWETKKIIQPGIFYFNVLPKSAEVYLDGKLKKKTDIFFGSALIENLLAKQYDIEIKKDGFYSWKKKLEIKKRQVTEAKNIVLIPINPEFNVIFKEINDFFFSPDEKKVILKEINKKDPENLSWSLKLFEIKRNFKTHLIDERDISPARQSPTLQTLADGKEEVQLIDLKFSSDLKRILLKLGLKERLMYYVLEIDKTPVVLLPLDFLDLDTEEVYFYPGNSQKLLLLKEGKLSEVDLVEKKISLPILENIVVLSISNNDIYYINESGFFLKNNLSFSQEERLDIIPISLKKEGEYKIEIADSYIFLKENNVLYVFDKNKKSFQKISEPVKNLRFSPDSKKIVYFNDHEIWVLFLEKKYDQPQKEAGEQLFLTRFSEKIDNVFWYTNHYLIFDIGNKIKIAEIDDRDKVNIVDLAEFKESRIFWNQNDKKLYVLTEENLHTSEKLAP